MYSEKINSIELLCLEDNYYELKYTISLFKIKNGDIQWLRFFFHSTRGSTFLPKKKQMTCKVLPVPFSIENRTEHYAPIAYYIQTLSQAGNFGGKGNLLKSVWDTQKLQRRYVLNCLIRHYLFTHVSIRRKHKYLYCCRCKPAEGSFKKN